MRFQYVILVILFLTSSGCAHFSQIQSLNDLQPGEAIAVAKMNILYNGEDVTHYANFMLSHIDQSGSKTIYQNGWHNEKITATNHYLFVHLPVGETNFHGLISRKGVFTSEYQYYFKDKDISFTLSEPGRVYYIGDLTINWSPKQTKEFPTGTVLTGAAAGVIAGGILGGVIMAPLAVLLSPTFGGEVVTVIQDEMPAAQKVFSERFGTDTVLLKSVVKFKNQ